MSKAGWKSDLKIKLKHSLENLVSRIRRNSPRDTGKLADSWRVSDNYIHLMDNGRDIRIDNPSLVAAVQEYGATIPAYHSPPGKVMYFDGIFIKFRSGFNIVPLRYIESSVEQWLNSDSSIEIVWENE